MNDVNSADDEFGFYDHSKSNYYLTNFYGATDSRDLDIPPKFRQDSSSNSYLIEIDGEQWPSTEHYFQASKFEKESDTWKEIKAAKLPRDAFDIARNNNDNVRADWQVMQPSGLIVKEELMLKALCAKFIQNPHLLEALQSTKSAYIAEHSPKDDYWGSLDIGNGPGQNRLGIMLTELREASKRINDLSADAVEAQLYESVATTLKNFPPVLDLSTPRTAAPQYKADYMAAHPELAEAKKAEADSVSGNVTDNPDDDDEKKEKKEAKFEGQLEGIKDNEDFSLPTWAVEEGWVKKGNDYFRGENPEPAFSIDHQERAVRLHTKAPEDIVDMIRMIKSLGADLVIKGPPDSLESVMVFAEAQRQGVTVRKFTPDPKTLVQAQTNLAEIQKKTPQFDSSTPDLPKGEALSEPTDLPDPLSTAPSDDTHDSHQEDTVDDPLEPDVQLPKFEDIPAPVIEPDVQEDDPINRPPTPSDPLPKPTEALDGKTFKERLIGKRGKAAKQHPSNIPFKIVKVADHVITVEPTRSAGGFDANSQYTIAFDKSNRGDEQLCRGLSSVASQHPGKTITIFTDNATGLRPTLRLHIGELPEIEPEPDVNHKRSASLSDDELRGLGTGNSNAPVKPSKRRR